MIITVERRFRADKYTIGRMYIDGNYFCDTLEDKDRDINKNGKFDGTEAKVMHETAIPYGTYDIKITYAPKFKRELPWLQNVPHFTGIMIHKGNNHSHTSGCILVGENKVKGGLINPSKYETELTRLIKEVLSKNEKVTVTIK